MLFRDKDYISVLLLKLNEILVYFSINQWRSQKFVSEELMCRHGRRCPGLQPQKAGDIVLKF